MAADACILCGAPPPLTGEHIWPDWYNRQQPKRKYELESIINGERRVYGTQTMNVNPKVLCRENKCNEQWGSDLENRVGPILTPLVYGEPKSITKSPMRLLAAWAFLKVMVSEYAGDWPIHFISLDHGKHLRATLRPPDAARIWIGRYDGSRSNAGWLIIRPGITDVSADPPAAVPWYSATLTVGQAAFHSFYPLDPVATGDIGHLKKPIPLSYVLPWKVGNWRGSLLPLWPTPSKPIAWPPEQSFDDDGLEYLADRWYVEQ
jgi:hypothetical protein